MSKLSLGSRIELSERISQIENTEVLKSFIGEISDDSDIIITLNDEEEQ